nr:hypothetical protein JVH1_9009 [Rhodococcus sp. JVH1]
MPHSSSCLSLHNSLPRFCTDHAHRAVLVVGRNLRKPHLPVLRRHRHTPDRRHSGRQSPACDTSSPRAPNAPYDTSGLYGNFSHK